MFVLYEGSVKGDYQGKTVLDLLGNVDANRKGERFSEHGFEGGTIWLYDSEEWADLVDYFFNDDTDGQPEEERIRDAESWLARTGMPRRISSNQLIVNMRGTDEHYRTFSHEIGHEEINNMLKTAFPDYGYRVVEE